MLDNSCVGQDREEEEMCVIQDDVNEWKAIEITTCDFENGKCSNLNFSEFTS
jgi:uncharacterized protein YjbI with pentapeptide repeats